MARNRFRLGGGRRSRHSAEPEHAVDDLRVGQSSSASHFARRRLRVAELVVERLAVVQVQRLADARVLLVRSHEQVCARSGRPKASRKRDTTQRVGQLQGPRARRVAGRRRRRVAGRRR